MARFTLASFLLILIIACNSRRSADNGTAAGKDTLTDDRYISTTPIPLAGCYSWVVNRDSALLKLDVTDDRVTGSLEYNWYERDRNAGTLQGVVRDSMIYADYTFRAEGMTSVREVAFKIKGDSLVEGYGDFDTDSDTIRFKDKAQLQFQDDRAFVKSACE